MSDYVDIVLPKRLSADQRRRMIAAHDRLLSTLNNPGTSKSAKESARRAMQELRKQIAMLGGKVSVASASYQTDPTTGEITGQLRKSTKPPAKATSVETAESHQVRTPLYLQTPVSKAGVLAAFPEAALKPGETRSQTPQAPAMASGITSSEGLRMPAAQRMNEATGQPLPVAAPTPAVPASAPATASTKPTVPTEAEDLSADPLLAALPPAPQAAGVAPSAPAESPEMTRLKALINQPAEPPPNMGLSTFQKGAYGFLAGLKGAQAVEPLISGQRAEAAQKYVFAQQQREAEIGNLLKIVQLQDAEAQRAGVAQAKAEERADEVEGMARQAFDQNQLAAPQIGGALAYIHSGDKDHPAPVNDPDPQIRQRAATIQTQIDAVQGIAAQIDNAIKTNPRALNTGQLALYKHATDTLHELIDKAITETARKAEAEKLPNSVAQQMKTISDLGPRIDSAIRQAEAGIGGPLTARFPLRQMASFFAPESAQQLGQFEAVLSTIEEIIRSIGPGAAISAVESGLFEGMFLRSTEPANLLIGKLKGLRAWRGAKLAGDQLEADKILLRMEAGVEPGQDDPIVGHSPDGHERWLVNGVEYDLVPEVAH